MHFFQVLSEGNLLPPTIILQGQSLITPYCLQLNQFYFTLKCSANLHQSLSPFEYMCLSSSFPPHTISSIYKLLIYSYAQQLPSYFRHWESELNKQLITTQWAKCFKLTYNAVIASKAQESSYKILSRWYRVPTILHKCYLSGTSSCRCVRVESIITHI